MTNRMLLNGSASAEAGHEEFRVALLKGASLYNLYIDRPGYEQKKSNIYKGKITRIEPSLEAVFVDYGSERHGFLPFKEISERYFKPTENPSSHNMRELLYEGQELMVQVDKEERGNKGAALTTYISLAGCYLVLMPNNPKAGGISRRIEGEERDELREIMNSLEIPEDMGMIIRTAGIGKNLEELRWDLNTLIKHWAAIEEAYNTRSAPFLIHQESDIIVRAVRDYLREDIDEILVDDLEVFGRTQQYVQQVRPDFLQRVKLYQSTVPLFSRFQIESQIEAAFQHEVRLPSGGAIVIDHTEALISIDINSARSTRGGDIEETALHTNLEAAKEIARQLRIRDIGGLIVIDFIDMASNRHQREVEECLRRELEADRARVQVGRISRFGLLEMSRQRLRASLGEATQSSCPRCHGHGSVRSVPSLSLSILRLIEEEALKESTGEVRAQLPVDIATFLLNEKRETISDIEKRHHARILIIPNALLETPNYKIDRIKISDTSNQKESLKSYQINYTPEKTDDVLTEATKVPASSETPAVRTVAIGEPHPSSHKAKPGLLSRILASIFGSNEKNKKLEEKKAAPTASTNRTNNHRPRPQHQQQRRHNPNFRPKKHHGNRPFTPRPQQQAQATPVQPSVTATTEQPMQQATPPVQQQTAPVVEQIQHVPVATPVATVTTEVSVETQAPSQNPQGHQNQQRPRRRRGHLRIHGHHRAKTNATEENKESTPPKENPPASE